MIEVNSNLSTTTISSCITGISATSIRKDSTTVWIQAE